MHISVLLDECIENLNLKETSTIIDATLGYAGHSSEILKKIKKGKLIAFDQDIEAIKESEKKLSKIGSNFQIVKSNFSNMKEEVKKLNIEKVDGILFDLGVSSPQLDEDYRGFSFHKDAKLDMRMDTSKDFSAYNVVNEYSYEELRDIFYKYGEDKFAPRIAKKIVEARENKSIETTMELVEIIKSAVPMKERLKKHPARQIFQAIRIEVNDELNVLSYALSEAKDMLAPGGRLVVISFHSLEDRIVKKYFKKLCEEDEKIKGLPNVDPSLLPDFKLITKKPIIPSDEEIERNPRSRSAKLRVIERVK